MLRIPPYVPPEYPEEPPTAPVEPIDLPVVDGIPESRVKHYLCELIDKAIEYLLSVKARLRAPLKEVGRMKLLTTEEVDAPLDSALERLELPEIEEEDAP
jgi:hypothetical protein